MFSRNATTRRESGFRGIIPSRTLGRMVTVESIIGTEAILHSEFSPGVSFYREQSALVPTSDSQCIQSYYPDFEAVLTTGELIDQEFKTVMDLAKPAKHGVTNV